MPPNRATQQATCTKIWRSSAERFTRYASGVDRQTDRHTHRNASHRVRGERTSPILRVQCERRFKLAFHDAHTDTDILARILADTSDTRDRFPEVIPVASRTGKSPDTPKSSRRSSRGCRRGCRCRGMPTLRWKSRCAAAHRLDLGVPERSAYELSQARRHVPETHVQILRLRPRQQQQQPHEAIK